MLSILKMSYKTFTILLLVSVTASAKSSDEQTPILFQDPSTELYGYKNAQGEVIIPPQFYQAQPFSKFGIANVLLLAPRKYRIQHNQDYREQDCCRIDTAGRIVEQAFFCDNAWDYYEEGLARYVCNGKIGFSNERGEHVIKACFDMAYYFRNGVAAVCQGDVKEFVPEGCCNGCIPKKCCCIPPDYKGGQWGVIDKKGNILVPLVHDDATKALAVFYSSDKVPASAWIETTATVVGKDKVHGKAEKEWVYTLDPDNWSGSDLRATSQRKLLQGQRVRIKYAKDAGFPKILGLLE